MALSTKDQPKTYDLEELKIKQLKQELLRDGEKTFREKYPSTFLVLITQPEPDLDLEAHRSSMTTNLEDITLEELIEEDEVVEPKNKICYAVAKSTRNKFSSRITVGRARNNDIVLHTKAVSLVHADFFQDKKDDWLLVDMGSTNGTRLNNRRLDKNEQIKVISGDYVSLASFTFQFMTWTDFHELLIDYC